MAPHLLPDGEGPVPDYFDIEVGGICITACPKGWRKARY